MPPADETAPLLRSESHSPDADARKRTGYCVSPVHNENGGSGSGVGQEEVQEVPRKSFLSLVIPMSIGIFLAAMDATIVVSSYAAIGSELNQLQNTSWIATAYMLTMTSFQPLYGKLSDIFGRKGCLLFAYSIFAIGSLMCGLSRNMTELIASRAFAGIGGGGMTTIVSIILSDVVPLRSRGTWQGVLNIVFATGSAAGAPLGGLFADTIGWRWAFLMQVPLALLAITAVSFALHLPKTDSSNFSAKIRRVDFGGAAALVVTVFLLLFGLDRGGNIAWGDTFTILALGGFALFAVVFGVVEMRLAREPLAPKRIIVNSSLIASYLVNFFGIAAGMSMLFHVSLYLQAVERKSASEAGLWLILSVAGSLFGSLGGGLVMQATGKFYMLTVCGYGLLFIGSGIVILMTGALTRSVHGLAVGLVVGSIGNGSGITTSLIALIANAGQADQAIATAVSYLFRSMGSVVGVSVGSSLVQETLRSYLRRKLSGDDVEEIIQRVRESLSYVDELDPATRAIVRSAYGQAVQVTLSFTVAMAACSLVSSIFIKEKALSR
ncbi:member of the major facilitator superfamily [Collybia nuda]|uniref:Member of the major facilitator superfamily n=1 Tax=Collybia nuda TaxID=64659 RepID=A0A9P6CD49_9AGAR|nr:member of the major facilitator superfamily [Collybia nuda]